VDITFDDYHPAHAPEAIALGGRFPMTGRLWRQNVDDDPNYAPGDGLLARDAGGALAGLALTRLFRRYDDPANADMERVRGLGWIVALAVAPEHRGRGLGGRLLRLAEERLRREGAAHVRLGGSVGHFLPGPPADDARTLRFWERNGYRLLSQVHDLRRGLADWAPPARSNGDYRIGRARPDQQGAILAFLGRAFPGRWRYDMTEAFARGASVEDVLVLEDRAGSVEGFLASWHFGSALLGPGAHWYPALGERFGSMGPLGIAESLRGRGLGLALVAAGMAALKERGVEESAIDWTELVDFYGKLGFRVWKSYWRWEDKPLAPG
jgi:predicted N-acetyltransferase YhbS